MARTKVDNKLNVVIGTKAQIEGDTSIPENSIVVVTDEEIQDKLIAGDNITIDENNVISAIGGGGGINDKIRFAFTTTPASTQAKIVGSNGFSNLIAGDLIYVLFQHGNTAEHISLNIEGTGNHVVSNLFAPEGWQQISSMSGVLVQYRDDDGEYFQPISILGGSGIPEVPNNDFYLRSEGFWYPLVKSTNHGFDINNGSEIRALMNLNPALMYTNVDMTNYKLLKVFGATDWNLGVFAQYTDLTTGEEYQMANVQMVVADTADPIWVKIGNGGGGGADHDIVLISDTAFTITQAHFNKTLIITSSSDVTITVPTQIVESIEKGFFCDIVRYGTGEVVFSDAGVVLNSAGPLSIDAQYIAASLIKIDDNNEWLLIGGRE